MSSREGNAGKSEKKQKSRCDGGEIRGNTKLTLRSYTRQKECRDAGSSIYPKLIVACVCERDEVSEQARESK